MIDRRRKDEPGIRLHHQSLIKRLFFSFFGVLFYFNKRQRENVKEKKCDKKERRLTTYVSSHSLTHSPARVNANNFVEHRAGRCGLERLLGILKGLRGLFCAPLLRLTARPTQVLGELLPSI